MEQHIFKSPKEKPIIKLKGSNADIYWEKFCLICGKHINNKIHDIKK